MKFLDQIRLNFATSGAEIVIDADQDGLPDAPPPDSNYRPADIEGIACWNCAHFEKTGTNDANWPAGICHLWEAQVQGQNVCDRFTADPTLYDGAPHSSPTEDYMPMLAEIQIPDTQMEFSAEKKRFRKAILRTCELDKTPTSQGTIRKKLKIVRDGASDLAKGVISLVDVKKAFDEKAFANVTVPLSDTTKDHKNELRLNQGFVTGVEIEDREDGVSELMAEMDITEPETAEKIERGTIPDVSSGIYGPVETPDGRKFPVALNHACLTMKPFLPDLSPFAVLASSDEDPVTNVGEFVPVGTEFTQPETEEEAEEDLTARLSFAEQEEALNKALHSQLNLSDHYFVADIKGNTAIVRSKLAEVDWEATFAIDESNSVTFSQEPSEWKLREEEGGEGSDEPVEPAVAPKKIGLSSDPLEQARQIRDLRVADMDNSEGGGTMPITGTDPLKDVELSDENAVRDLVKRLAEDNQRLRSKTQESEISEEIERVKELGFAEEPGFLSVYRDILLSDDGEPAMILLSHDEGGKETKREQPTVTDIAKRLINALRTDDESGKVLLAQQHVSSGTDDPPPATEEKNDNSPEAVRERAAKVGSAIGQEMPESGGE